MSATVRRSLFARLMAAYTLVVVIAFGIAATMTIFAGRGPLQRLIVEDLTLRCTAVQKEVDRYLFERGQEVRAWSTLGTMDDVLIGDQALRIENLILNLQREQSGYLAALTVLDRDEVVVASTDLAQIGRPRSLRELGLREIPGGELRVGELPGEFLRQDAAVIMVHPILSRLDPDPIGWVFARISWAPVVKMVTGAEIGGQSQDADRFLMLVDEADRVVAAQDEAVARLPEIAGLATSGTPAGVSTESLASGQSYLVAHLQGTAMRSLLGPGARIIALWRTDEAYALVRLFVGSVLASAVLGLALAVLASSVIARGISVRIGKLTAATEALAHGDLNHRVDRMQDDELGLLAISFNSMATRLADAKEKLEETLARWQAVIAHAPDLIMTVDRDGTIVFANRTLLSGGFMEGTTVYSHAQPEYHDRIRRKIAGVFETGEAASLEIEGPGMSRGTAWYACRIGPIVREGRVESLTVIVTDVTERKRLEKEILEVDELERERIGQDLHDGLGQILTGISLLTKGLEQKFAKRVPMGQTEVEQIGLLCSRAIDQARGLARGLHPITVERAGLRKAVEELASGVSDMFEVACRVEGELPTPPPTAQRAMHLFRIVQEAVNNALRHARPSNIVIAFSNGADGARLTITDDGIGIPDPPPDSPGIGLRLMRHRAHVIGASLEIRRGLRRGTRVTCRLG